MIKINPYCVIIIFLFILGVQLSKSQHGNDYYYYFTSKQLQENSKKNRIDTCQLFSINHEDKVFQIGRCWDFEGDLPEILSLVSMGKIRYKNNLLYCYDKRLNRTYRFKQINLYTLEALNHTAVFVKGTRLYLHVHESGNKYFSAFLNIDDLLTTDYWNTGIRNGIFYYRNDEYLKMIYYQRNLAIDSVTSTISDSLSKIKMDNFKEKYYLLSRDK